MVIGIRPTVDCVFKNLFGSDKNKDLLLCLLNAIQKASKEDIIVSIELLNPFNLQNYKPSKLSILDIKAKNEKGEYFLLEMQIEMYASYPQRILYYWAKNYSSQLMKGDNYKNLKKTTIISISEKTIGEIEEDEEYY